MAFFPDKVIKAVLRDCSIDMIISEMSIAPIATHFVGINHFTEEESLRCHADIPNEEQIKVFLEILNTKKDESLDVLIEYLDKKNQMQPHLVRILTAARDRRRINPDDDDEEDPSDLAPGDFYLTLSGVEIIRNIVMASPTAKGKWLDIATYIIQSVFHITKLKAVNAGRPEKMIDMSLEFWIGGAESDHRPTFDTLIEVLETRKMKKLAACSPMSDEIKFNFIDVEYPYGEMFYKTLASFFFIYKFLDEILKKKEKIARACEVPVGEDDAKTAKN